MKCPECDAVMMLDNVKEAGPNTKCTVEVRCVRGHSVTATMDQAYAPWLKGLMSQATEMGQLLAGMQISPPSIQHMRDRVYAMLADVAQLVVSKPVEAPVEEEPVLGEVATIYTDGSCHPNPGPAGYGFIIEHGTEESETSCPIDHCTNNEAEYAGIVGALEAAVALGIKDVVLNSDSQLAVRQINGQYKCEAEKLRPLFEQVKLLMKNFDSIVFQYIPGSENPAHHPAEAAYRLSKKKAEKEE